MGVVSRPRQERGPGPDGTRGNRHIELFSGRQPPCSQRRRLFHRLAPDAPFGDVEQDGAKSLPRGKAGHFCAQAGRLVVIEYSDLPMALQRETVPSGTLRYMAGSIAIHVLDRDFIRRMARAAGTGIDALPFHRADKKVLTIDFEGRPVKPEKPNGVKFELFVFDAIAFARNPVIVETRRCDDFPPSRTRRAWIPRNPAARTSCASSRAGLRPTGRLSARMRQAFRLWRWRSRRSSVEEKSKAQ